MTWPNKYNLNELVAQCDPDAPIPEELAEWDRAPAVGLERDASNMRTNVASFVEPEDGEPDGSKR
jgi:antitoxin ChpS